MMENEQGKKTQNTAIDGGGKTNDFSSPNFSDKSQSKTSDFAATDNKTTDFGGGEFGNAGTVNADSSKLGGSTTELNTDSVKETARGLYDSAKSTAGQAFGAATKRATEALDEKKVTVASGLTSVADSIKQVGDNLNTSTEETNPIAETAAKYTNSLAQQIEHLSGYFERKDVREMVRDVEGFARRHPAYFIGGAVALGFLAARFLKSSNPKHSRGGAGRTFGEISDREKKLTAGETLPGAGQF